CAAGGGPRRDEGEAGGGHIGQGGDRQQPRNAGTDKAQATIPLSQGGGAGGGHRAGGVAAARAGVAAGIAGTVPRWRARQGDNARLRGNEGATATPLHSLGRGRRTELIGYKARLAWMKSQSCSTYGGRGFQGCLSFALNSRTVVARVTLSSSFR